MDEDLTHESLEVGAMPVVRRFMDHLGLEELFDRYVPHRSVGRPAKLSSARALSTMVTNVLLSRLPLYSVPHWASHFVPEHLGLRPEECSLLNDDRIGRALDDLYAIDPASLMTALVTRAIRTFDIDLRQIHTDTTTVQFAGAYKGQKPPDATDRPPLINFGYTKKGDRPDFKQLVYGLSITADGAVPVHFKTYDGNTTDDQIHKEIWSTMRELVGAPTFVYVADSKLCTRENMAWIDGQGGTFITVLPETRSESRNFKNFLREGGTITWSEVRREKNPRRKDRPDAVYDAHEPKDGTSEGYRVIWFRSSQKMELDAQRRADQIAKAKDRITRLEMRRGSHAFKSEDDARQAAQEVLEQEGVVDWLNVVITQDHVSDFRQVGPGRPGKNTRYRAVHIPIFLFNLEDRLDAIRADARCDGVFPLITNASAEHFPPRRVLDLYKYQPFLEKRNEQLKSVLKVAPVFLHKVERVAALLFVYFLAMLLMALIERELRRKMKAAGMPSLPLYPEERLCKAPTWEVILENLQGLRRHRIIADQDRPLRTFYDRPSPVAVKVLKLLGIDPAHFGTR